MICARQIFHVLILTLLVSINTTLVVYPTSSLLPKFSLPPFLPFPILFFAGSCNQRKTIGINIFFINYKVIIIFNILLFLIKRVRSTKGYLLLKPNTTRRQMLHPHSPISYSRSTFTFTILYQHLRHFFDSTNYSTYKKILRTFSFFGLFGIFQCFIALKHNTTTYNLTVHHHWLI